MTAETGLRRAPWRRAARRSCGRVLVWAPALLLALLSSVQGAEPLTVDVQVRSGVAAGSNVVFQAASGIRILDRTPGARPATAGQGPASVGETFTEEITLELPGYAVPRPTIVEVRDALVSLVRVETRDDVTTVAIAVRQPVSYTVTRPNGLGEFTVEVRPRTTKVAGGQRRHDPSVTRPRDPDEIAVDAENLAFDQDTNTLVATGNVTITRGDMTLQANEVRYDRTNGTADAKGNVRLTDPEGVVEGDSAHVSIEEETGWVDHARTRLDPPGYSVACERLEKRGGPLYGVTDGSFTTCKCGALAPPSWSLKGKQTDIRLEGMAVIKNATFRLLDVPVLWFPVFAFPANTDRQSGFLLPRVSFSKRRGFQWQQPFYWAIDKSHDATISVDVETNARIGVMGEYRYALSQRAQGQFTAAYFNEANRRQETLYEPTNPAGETVDVNENRFAVAGTHRQAVPGVGRFYLDMLAVSDAAFLREINTFASPGQQDGSLRTLRYTTSKAGFLRTWQQGYLQTQVKYNQDLINPQELVPQQLPRIEGEHSVPVFGDRVVARMAGNLTYYQRDAGFDGTRVHFAPDVFVPLPLGPYLSGSVVGRIRETAYFLTDAEQTALVQPDADVPLGIRFRRAPELARLATTRSQFSGEVSARIATALARVYTVGNLGKLRHSIEPELQYLWIPDIDRPVRQRQLGPCGAGDVAGVTCRATLFSEGYLFDRDDAINERNFASWGLSTRLLWRELSAAERTIDPADDAADTATPAVREILRASVTHGYDLSRALVGASHASDIDVGARLSPLPWVSFKYDATLSLERGRVRGQTVGLAIREPNYKPPGTRALQLPAQFDVRYGFIADEVNKLADRDPEVQRLLSRPGSHSVGANMYLRLGDYFGLFGSASYDFNPVRTTVRDAQGNPTLRVLDPHLVDWSVFLRFISRCDCWSIDVGVREHTNEAPLDDRQFRVQFTLIGLGSFGRGASPNLIGFGPTGQSRNGLIGGGF
jgi:LPS transport system D/LptA/(LptD N-terminal domain) LPS transport protein